MSALSQRSLAKCCTLGCSSSHKDDAAPFTVAHGCRPSDSQSSSSTQQNDRPSIFQALDSFPLFSPTPNRHCLITRLGVKVD
ncbi:hypothetical protein PoB_002270300 [Plakobranchus ocellatus]|uniref:Uncharacterized protein n=1 Tax=Plakobranchus ocellatus TaxID=259542 RepID=A0AAV3ZMY1_9GAST|nr:hypothetical protein PoB_002270300 [Plakobranchus ocellatus]